MKMSLSFFRISFRLSLFTVIFIFAFCNQTYSDTKSPLLLSSQAEQQTSNVSCQDLYDVAYDGVRKARIGRDLEDRVLSRLRAGMRLYQAANAKLKLYANRNLFQALSLLESNAALAVPTSVRESLKQTIQPFKTCVATDIRKPGLLTVIALTDNGNGMFVPAGEGVSVRINGFEMGVTGPDSSVTLPVRPGDVEILAIQYPLESAGTTVAVTSGATVSATLQLEDGAEAIEAIIPNVQEVRDGVLPSTFSSFKVRFYRESGVSEESVTPTYLSDVSLITGDGVVYDLTSVSSIQSDGSVNLTSVPALRDVLAVTNGPFRIRWDGEKSDGRGFRAEVPFEFGRYRLTGKLQAPPSFSSLNVSGVQVTFNVPNSNLTFRTITAANGTFDFPFFPAGVVEFNAEILANGKYYYGQGSFAVTRSYSLQINMRNITDVQNNVLPFTTTPLFGEKEPFTPVQTIPAMSRKFPLSFDGVTPFKPFYNMPLPAPEDATVQVTAAGQDVAVSQTSTVTLPQGTQQVILKYTTQTAEYPVWVQQQSVYNDVWSINVWSVTDGRQLFSIQRNVNSQVHQAPLWQSNGSTGEIQEVINVSSLTQGGSVTIALWASTTNIGDAQLPTSVQANLGCTGNCEGDFKILEVKPDKAVPKPTANGVSATNGDSTYFSIPASGAKNFFERTFTLKLRKPTNVTIGTVKAEVRSPTGNMNLFEEGVGGANVQQIDATTLRVRVTMHTFNSTVVTIPPPTNTIWYYFKITATQNGNPVTPAEKESELLHPLWRMPTGFARYSAREPGEDDWCSDSTFGWLDSNRLLITKINDISGEHSLNLTHSEHTKGTDIDMYHFYTFPGAISGKDNYNKLLADVLVALQNAAAKQRVKDWVTVSRTGLSALDSNASTVRIIYARGSTASGLTTGWAETLLKTGQVTVNGQLLNLGIGTTWSCTKCKFKTDHNDHIHIDLFSIE